MSSIVKVSGKNQIVVPKEARESLHIKSGTKLLVMVKEGRVILVPEPDDYVKALKGLGKEVWEESAEYLKKERENW
ncbi:MAG: AbrB/MazE/SpoVT family DNA-binding domain-containing protein [bacterium]